MRDRQARLMHKDNSPLEPITHHTSVWAYVQAFEPQIRIPIGSPAIGKSYAPCLLRFSKVWHAAHQHCTARMRSPQSGAHLSWPLRAVPRITDARR